MIAVRLPDGNLRIPTTYIAPSGAIVDGARVIGADDPEYAKWDAWMKAHGHESEVPDAGQPPRPV